MIYSEEVVAKEVFIPVSIHHQQPPPSYVESQGHVQLVPISERMPDQVVRVHVPPMYVAEPAAPRPTAPVQQVQQQQQQQTRHSRGLQRRLAAFREARRAEEHLEQYYFPGWCSTEGVIGQDDDDIICLACLCPCIAHGLVVNKRRAVVPTGKDFPMYEFLIYVLVYTFFLYITYAVCLLFFEQNNQLEFFWYFTLCRCLVCAVGYRSRRLTAEALGIPEPSIITCCTHCWCSSCAHSQEYNGLVKKERYVLRVRERHLEARARRQALAAPPQAAAPVSAPAGPPVYQDPPAFDAVLSI